MMTFSQYVGLAMRTHAEINTQQCHLLGLYGESGEVVDLVKKIVYHQVPVTALMIDKMRLEIGDVLWYVAAEFDRLALNSEHGLPELHTSQRIEHVALSLSRTISAYDNGRAKITEVLDSINMFLAAFIYHCRQLPKDPTVFSSNHCRRHQTSYLEMSMSDCMQANILKLQKRYPDKFNTSDSIARVDLLYLIQSEANTCVVPGCRALGLTA